MTVSPKLERAAPVLARVEAARVLAPRRDGLEAALAALTDVHASWWSGHPAGSLTIGPNGVGHPQTGGTPWTTTDAAEAWELLATRGVIPLAWVGDARRAFWCAACGGARGHESYYEGERDWVPCGVCAVECAACGGGGIDANTTGGTCRECGGHCVIGVGSVPHPPTVAACVALASDVAGVTQAEQLALEIAGRIDAWVQRVVWRAVPADATRAAMNRAGQAWAGRLLRDCSPADDVAGIQSCILDKLETGRPTRYLAGELQGVTHECAIGAADAIVDLLATGYALDAVTDDAVVLVAPAIDDGAPAGAGEEERGR